MRVGARKAVTAITRSADPRVRFVSLLCILAFGIVLVRLFVLMVLQHGFYTALASGTHEISAELLPKRGSVYIQDSRSGAQYPLAINHDVFLLFADTRELTRADHQKQVLDTLTQEFSYESDRVDQVRAIISKIDDPYEPIEKNVSEEVKERLQAMNLPGIGFVRQTERLYPEGPFASTVVGFLGRNDDGQRVGKYGIEGYWQKELAGTGGFLEGVRGAAGSWIPKAGRFFKPAEDGVDLVLTIDRTLQFRACERLKEGMEEYEAQSAALVIIEPHTGKIRAMCSLPEFDPNVYNEVENIQVYNNESIFTAYEPGSIFKPIVMGAALNEELVRPSHVFHDTGVKEDICDTPIKNAGEKIRGDQTMTGVLEYSINTGMVYVAELLGKKKLAHYVDRFGFGLKTGIELDSEGAGTTDSLRVNRGDKLDCYGATASFGQGITATPLQMVSAFGAIANGGTLMRPLIIDQIVHPDGTIEKKKSEQIHEVFDHRAVSLLSGMLVRVIDSGQAGGASVPGYYVAGKTGTAQIPGPGGYTEETNHSFVGFAPVDNPKFAMIVKYEKPQRDFSSMTAAPVFGDIAKMILDYYAVPPGR